MRGSGQITIRLGRDGKKTWQAEQVGGSPFCQGPDPGELRAWVADDTELGKRVADAFLSAGRCLPGTLDRVFFEVQLRRFPDPGDAPKRRAGLGRACQCQDESHYRQVFRDGGIHSAPPARKSLSGLFWTAVITTYPKQRKESAQRGRARLGVAGSGEETPSDARPWDADSDSLARELASGSENRPLEPEPGQGRSRL
jgi:hypothetical protein